MIDQRRASVAGFTGSAGTAVVTEDPEDLVFGDWVGLSTKRLAVAPYSPSCSSPSESTLASR